MKRIQGTVTVTVERRKNAGVDEMLIPVFETEIEQVDDCIIADGSQTNTPLDALPDAARVAKTLYVPRTYPWRSLAHCTVLVDGVRYTVVGDPEPVGVVGSPTRYHPVGVQLSRTEL